MSAITHRTTICNHKIAYGVLCAKCNSQTICSRASSISLLGENRKAKQPQFVFDTHFCGGKGRIEISLSIPQKFPANKVVGRERHFAEAQSTLSCSDETLKNSEQGLYLKKPHTHGYC